jgi:hypothetical protein
LRVGREEADRQREGLILRAGPQEVDRVARVLFGNVDALAVGSGHPMRAFVRAKEVEIAGPRRADAVLAHIASPVARSPEDCGVGIRERVRRNRPAERVDAMPRHVLARQQRRPAHHANRRRDARLVEAHPILRQPIDPRRPDNRVARGADRVPSRIVDDEQDDVQGLRGRRRVLL